MYLKGVKLALITAGISGFAVFINKFGVAFWGNPFTYTTAKNIIAAVFLAGLVVFLRKFPELKQLSKGQWFKLVLIGLIGGAIPFLLFFKALTIVSAPQAAFIHKTLFLWVALFSYPFLKERLSKVQLLALGILFCGVFLFSAPAQWVLGMGTLMALIATILWAIENIIAKIVLRNVSAITVGWARMFFGSLFLLVYLGVTGNISGLVPASLAQVGWTLLVGAVLFGYVFSWYSALKHAPATVVSSVLVLAAPLTAILNAIFVTHVFPVKVIVPLLLMGVAVLLVSKQLESFYSRFVRRKAEI